MAKFLRLKIRGIRSVGDEDEDMHDIHFLSPCTLINGPNGTGKTTTIEALNYITTGTIPAGGFSNFIHSNSLSRKNRVDASVMLEFVDFKNRVCTAVRRVSASKGKDGKVKFKSEESTLTVKFKDGTEKSTSSKVCDFDKTILFHLGVPKAIFNHVIFCHQEDSTWPLSEPKELKQKFDQIFELTKFVKAQDQMKSFKKKMEIDHRVQTERQRRCEDMLKLKFEKKQIQETLINNIKKGEKKIKETKEFRLEKEREKTETERQISSMEKTLRELDQLSVEVYNINEQIKLLRVNEYNGTLNQLKEEIQEVKQKSGEQDYNIRKMKIDRETEKINKEIENLFCHQRYLEDKISELKAHEKHRGNLIENLTKLENNVRKEWNIEDDISFDVAIENKILEKKQEIEEALKTSSNSQEDVQSIVDEAQKKLTELEVCIKNKQEEGRKLESEIEILEKKEKSIGGASKLIKELTIKKQEIEKQLSNMPEFEKDKFAAIITQRENSQKKLEKLNRILKEVEQKEMFVKELNTKIEEIENSKMKYHDLLKKHEPNWEALYGDVERPEVPWTISVNEACEGIRSGLHIIENQLKEAELSAQKTRTIIEQLKNEGKKLKMDIETRSQKLLDECGCEPTEVAQNLIRVQKIVKDLRKNLAPIDAKIVLYESWIEDTKKKSCCPLCERKFNSSSVVTTFSQKLQNISIQFPNEKGSLESELIKMEQEEQRLLKGEHEAKELIKIKQQVDIIRENLKKNREILNNDDSIIQERKEKRDECLKSLEHAMALQADVMLVDTLAENIEKFENETQILKNKIENSQIENGLSCIEIKKEIEQLEKQVRNYVKEGDELQKLANKRNTLQAELNKIREERVSLGEAATQGSNIRDQLNEKRIELEVCLKQFRLLEMEMPAARKKIEVAIMERTQINDEKRENDLKLTTQLNKLKHDKQSYNSLQQNFDQLNNLEKECEFTENELKQIKQELERHQKKKIFLESETNDLNGSMSKLRELEYQLTRMGLDQKKKAIEGNINTLRQLGIDREIIKVLNEKLKNIQNDLRKSCEDDVRVMTKMQEYEAHLIEINKKLNEEDVKNAEKNYRDSVLELTMLKETSLDLQKYLKCLEVSLLRFHTEKMREINNIIDELWRKVYDSSDIETIKIKSNEKGVKSYDYSVLMVQEGGNELEMRGRCSAGQKMLASLLIRIALAEVFGGLCSIMALDEPTTNLDDMKVEKMADILNELIASRQVFNNDDEKSRGTQMVVITHDERLTNRLTTGCRPDYIYVLDKNEQGLSFLKLKMPNGEEKLVNYRH